MLLDNKLAIVTGASGGLGTAIARGLAQQGARAILLDLDVARTTALASEINRTGRWAAPYAVDVTDSAAVDSLAATIMKDHGDVDILINSAGIAGRARFDDPKQRETWDRILSVNVQGVFNMTYSFVESLKRSKGCVVNLASTAAFVSMISTPGYVVSKGAVRSFTQAVARDLAPHGVRVNAIAPGLMNTEMTSGLRASGTDWYLERTPMHRHGEANEIVGPVIFLASSSMSSYVTGVTLPVDGGFLSV